MMLIICAVIAISVLTVLIVLRDRKAAARPPLRYLLRCPECGQRLARVSSPGFYQISGSHFSCDFQGTVVPEEADEDE